MVVKVKPGNKKKTRNRVKVKDLAKSRHELTAQDMKRVKGGAPATSTSTPGTVGPQGGDATVVQGVNTAGTVRVNDLAN